MAFLDSESQVKKGSLTVLDRHQQGHELEQAVDTGGVPPGMDLHGSRVNSKQNVQVSDRESSKNIADGVKKEKGKCLFEVRSNSLD